LLTGCQLTALPLRRTTPVALLRLGCYLPLAQQADFLAALKALGAQLELEVLYYFDRKIAPQVNLMVFFGNGRPGVGGQPLRYTDTAALKTAVLASLAAHGGVPHRPATRAAVPTSGAWPMPTLCCKNR
jgi:hypothetical protein